ncbi:hypothetical protein EDB84DRAFT_1437862 [Lactarius hengduanensis]|nr:hypothetical protein EDB84DRAFT_1437862 [Lactarius hengduanensis]
MNSRACPTAHTRHYLIPIRPSRWFRHIRLGFEYVTLPMVISGQIRSQFLPFHSHLKSDPSRLTVASSHLLPYRKRHLLHKIRYLRVIYKLRLFTNASATVVVIVVGARPECSAKRTEHAAVTTATGLVAALAEYLPSSLPTPCRRRRVVIVARAAWSACVTPLVVVAIVVGGCGSTSGGSGFSSGVAWTVDAVPRWLLQSTRGVSGARKGEIQENALTTCSDVTVLGPVASMKGGGGWHGSVYIQDSKTAHDAEVPIPRRYMFHLGTASTVHATPLLNPLPPDVDPQPPTTIATTTRGVTQVDQAARATMTTRRRRQGVGKEDGRYSANAATSPVAVVTAACSVRFAEHSGRAPTTITTTVAEAFVNSLSL